MALYWIILFIALYQYNRKKPTRIVWVVKEDVSCIKECEFKYFLIIYQDRTLDLSSLVILGSVIEFKVWPIQYD